MKILHLTVTKQWFNLMVSGKKTIEIRKPSKWILSRLIDKAGKPRHYDYVKFTNGYGKDKPFFMAVYNGFGIAEHSSLYSIDDGFDTIDLFINKGDLLIWLGKVEMILY